MEYFHQHPHEAAQAMSKRLRISPSEVLTGYDGLQLPGLRDNQRLFEGSSSPLIQSTRQLAQVMRAHALLSQENDPAMLIDHRFLEALRE